MTITHKGNGLSPKPANSATCCAHPYVAFPIFGHGNNLVGTQTAGIVGMLPIANESTTLTIQFEDAIARSTQPQNTIFIFINRAYPGKRSLVGICSTERIVDQLLLFSINCRQSISKGKRDPYGSGMIFAKGDLRVGPLGCCSHWQRKMLDDPSRLAIEEIESFCRRYPKCAVSRLQCVANQTAAQT